MLNSVNNYVPTFKNQTQPRVNIKPLANMPSTPKLKPMKKNIYTIPPLDLNTSSQTLKSKL